MYLREEGFVMFTVNVKNVNIIDWVDASSGDIRAARFSEKVSSQNEVDLSRLLNQYL